MFWALNPQGAFRRPIHFPWGKCREQYPMLLPAPYHVDAACTSALTCAKAPYCPQQALVSWLERISCVNWTVGWGSPGLCIDDLHWFANFTTIYPWHNEMFWVLHSFVGLPEDQSSMGTNATNAAMRSNLPVNSVGTPPSCCWSSRPSLHRLMMR